MPVLDLGQFQLFNVQTELFPNDDCFTLTRMPDLDFRTILQSVYCLFGVAGADSNSFQCFFSLEWSLEILL